MESRRGLGRMHFTSKPHPYGVLPAGNRYFVKESETKGKRNALLVRSLGLGPWFRRLSDEALIELLSFLCGESLASLSLASSAFYIYAHHGELWRDLTLKLSDGKVGIEYVNNWKDTFVQTYLRIGSKGGKFISHKPIRVEGIYSNLLYRSWACFACDLASSCPGFYNTDIPRVSAKDLSITQFIEEYESQNKPVVITSAVEDWPALTKWTEENLIAMCGDRKMRATSATAPLSADFSAAEYFQYARQAKEEAPLYLFERNFAKIASSSNTDYTVPSYFSSSDVIGTDLFRLFGETRRPDHKWLIAGPARSGSIFHIDPNQTNAWNVCIKGRKKWIFYPPGISPPGVESSTDGADVAVPISTGEWMLSFWKFHMHERENPDISKRPMEVILEPGEVIFVPHNYWHMVVNLDDCIAITHNYVSTSNLSDCLRFLRETPDQISGVRDRKQNGAVQPETMYEELLEHLHKLLGDEAVHRFVQASQVPLLEASSDSAMTRVRKRTAEAVRIGKKQSKKRKEEKEQEKRKGKGEGEGEGVILDPPPKKPDFSFGFSFDDSI